MTLKRCNLTLPLWVFVELKRIGSGNASRGVRNLVRQSIKNEPKRGRPQKKQSKGEIKNAY